MPRFFITEDCICDGVVLIKGDDAYHIARSLRMAVGDSVIVTVGDGNEYECRLSRIRDEECEAQITECRPSISEPPFPITLYMAYPKGDKLETVVQKAVELGAAKVVPFESQRCIKRPDADKAKKQTDRLCRIAREAAKQCGRGRLPKVEPHVKFDKMLTLIKEHSLTLFCYEGEGAVSLRAVLEGITDLPKSLGIIVGSEGGFSPTEAELILAAGAECVNLGPRILRCETAPDYVLSAISYRFELQNHIKS